MIFIHIYMHNYYRQRKNWIRVLIMILMNSFYLKMASSKKGDKNYLEVTECRSRGFAIVAGLVETWLTIKLWPVNDEDERQCKRNEEFSAEWSKWANVWQCTGVENGDVQVLGASGTEALGAQSAECARRDAAGAHCGQLYGFSAPDNACISESRSGVSRGNRKSPNSSWICSFRSQG